SKNGRKLRLRGQPFQVLAMLLERPGEIITREELQQRLWPAGTFVDFDHSLNTVIKRIREGLGDSAEEPRFVETLPRRGYRFIAPVDGLSPTSPPDSTEFKTTFSTGHQWPQVNSTLSPEAGAKPEGSKTSLVASVRAEEALSKTVKSK